MENFKSMAKFGSFYITDLSETYTDVMWDGTILCILCQEYLLVGGSIKTYRHL